MSIADYSPHASARRFDSGTPPVPSLYAGVAGISLVEETGVPAIEAHVHALGDRLIDGLDGARRDGRDAREPPRARPARVRPLDRRRRALVAALAAERIVVSSREDNAADRAPPLQRRGGRRHPPRRARAAPLAARLSRRRRAEAAVRDAWNRLLLSSPRRRPRRASHTATTPTRSRTSTCPPGRAGRGRASCWSTAGSGERGWDRTLMTPLALDLARRGIAAWNIEYRRVGQEGGGWPGTFEDVAAAVDHLAELEQVDAATGGDVRALRRRAPRALARGTSPPRAGGVGAAPRVRPVAAVSQAGVCDLERAWRDDLGDGAVAGLLGPLRRGLGPIRGRIACRARAARRPTAARPRRRRRRRPGLAEPRLRRPRPAGASSSSSTGVDHFDVVDVEHAAWVTARGWLSTQLVG